MSASEQALVVVVTGAGSGIGRAVSRRLLADGHRVVLAGRRAEALEESAEGHSQALCVPCDVTDRAQVDALFARVEDAAGRVDALMTNAGRGASGSVDELDPQDFEAVMAVNVTGTVLCARAAVALMRRQRPQGGRIITNGSISAHSPRPSSVAYTVSKHAITGLTKCIELDGRAIGVRATQLDIGNAATEMTARMDAGVPQADGRRMPEPRFDPSHVGDLVAYLVRLPLEVTVPFVTIAASGMPFIARG